MFSFANTIVPRTRSAKVVSPAGTLKSPPRGAPPAPRRAPPPGGGDLEAHRARRAVRLETRQLLGRPAQARAIVGPRLAAGFRVGAAALEVVGCAVAVIGKAALDERVRARAIAIQPLRLEVRRVRAADVGAFIPVEPEPAQPVDDPGHHLP